MIEQFRGDKELAGLFNTFRQKQNFHCIKFSTAS